MTISDALPVQFWAYNCDTYNEKAVDGIFPKCFCQPFNSDDEITIQFQDTTGYTRRLLVVDSDDEVLYDVLFVETSTGLYQKSFIPSSQGITEDEVQLFIHTGVLSKIIAPTFWSNKYAAVSMTKSATQFTQAVVFGSNWGNDQVFGILIPTGTVISFDVVITITGVWTGTLALSFSIIRNGGIESAIETTNYTTNQSGVTLTVTLNKTLVQDLQEDLRIAVSGTASGTANLTVTMPVGDVLYYSTSDLLAKSDCLDIKENHNETVLINYHNNRIFASLNSAVGTPDPEFNLRIPAVFFEERYPRESEGITLSNSRSLQLMAEIKKQRLLRVKHMPDYMHLKTILALSFQTVTIDGYTWKLDEAYEKNQGNIRFPLRSALAWLTDRNYTQRNVL